MDAYYYYAICIFIISVSSIAATVAGTRSVRHSTDVRLKLLTYIQTMRRLRDISLFECDVRVLRNGFCKLLPAYRPSRSGYLLPYDAGRSVPSQELVPGDVFEFSDPSLNQVPCDCILLSGDCIVNESMLTG